MTEIHALRRSDLNQCLDALDRSSDRAWVEALSPRKREEHEFHNNLHGGIQRGQEEFMREHGNIEYYKVARKSVDYLENWLAANCAGRICLDVACGNGGNVIRMARAGAALAIGIDISSVSVANARARASAEGLPKDTIRFAVMDAENSGLPSGSFDVITCAGVLHHMDVSYVFPELRRLLVPGGKILAYEALNQNPLIRLYRRRTPQMRTRWEEKHILGPAELRFASRFFEIGEVRYWNLATILGRFVPHALPMLEATDKVLLRVPGLRRMAWMFTFELVNASNRL